MSEIRLTNIPSMNVGKVIKELSDAYCKIINNKLPIRTLPSVMLWGAPGVGKSQAIRQLAKEIEENTGKRTVVTDVRLLLFNPIDLRGIPTANADKTLAVWLKPQIFQMDDSEDIVNILFLDEISAAPQSVQAAAYQITLDRVVGEHKLPENCIVIAAGNLTTDKSVAYKMPKALANRLLHIEVEGSFKSWKEWAIRNGINNKVIGFLSFRQNYLMCFDSSSDDLAFATPRSWEMVSNLLNYVSDDIEKMYSLISGLVGSGVAKGRAIQQATNKNHKPEWRWDNHSRCGMYEEDAAQRDVWVKRFEGAAQAIEIRDPSNSRGLLPRFAQRILGELRKPQTDWRTILNDFIQEEVADYSFSPPDRRFDDCPFFLPDFNGKEDMVEDILFMIDTSGSMSDAMITAAYSEIKGAIDQFDGKLKGWLGFFDAAIIKPKPFSNEDEFRIIRPAGGGGTDFQIIFEYVHKHMQDKLPASIIILTDGYAPFPQEKLAMNIPVLWLINNNEVDPPWGKVARITV